MNVAVVMGSDSDLSVMKEACTALTQFGISYELKIISAHRTPDVMSEFARSAKGRGLKIIIAGAGGAAHLPGMLAAQTPLPVIGVPIVSTSLYGLDSLYSIVQMPKGVPVATVAINGAFNAGKIYMPTTTPKQKIEKVKKFGDEWIELELTGDTYDDAYTKAIQYAEQNKLEFIHPFDDYDVICGQGTVGLEILDETSKPLDFLFVPVGGGGLTSGILKVFSELSPNTRVIVAEPNGAPSLKEALKQGKVVELEQIDPFVDGASVRKVGTLNFEIISNHLSEQDVCLVPEGKICSTILELYNLDAIVAEPAGALAISALDFYKKDIKGKNVTVILSGGNNDISRMEEMKEKSLIYEKLKHYFVVSFPQRPGALRNFLSHVLGQHDDITYFQYSKKLNRDKGPAIIA
ncbi:hypothetical protein CHS0354_000815 [Potamilus streckersoni]|uniref:phosphoribosylaminoimidazole carboxylase n=1 Tax=Potamilus streckersoni TaxID=2493646 RepID=A0AAE0W895_9BIVA|nr:hypothetical protein CHS0354_000815 [Potamilus streckersoni]